MSSEAQPGVVHGQAAHPAGPCLMVIFGASGDLTKRLLVPALNNLQSSNLLPENFSILGVSRAEETDESFRKSLDDFIQQQAAKKNQDLSTNSPEGKAWHEMLERTHYMTGEFDEESTFEQLKARIAEMDGKYGAGGNVLFYLAVAPAFFSLVVKQLGKAGLTKQDNCWRRVIVEKPFGSDLPSARKLNQELMEVLDESQIFRIDHYQGKEMVQNIMALRFANGFLEPLWNRDHIDHMQISVAEITTVEERGKFYEATGAMRDMVGNHLSQLLSLAAMEVPQSFDADAVRNEKVKVLRSVRPFTEEMARDWAVRGQYAAGKVGDREVTDYRKEQDVDPNSNRETFVAMKVMIDNWRWAGVPFYLRTGKAMARREAEIAIRFKQAPFTMFPEMPVSQLAPNYIVLHIQPDQGISIAFNAKVPGPTVQMEGVSMKFSYKDYFTEKPGTGYETLLYDCMLGDATLFQRADNVEAGWAMVQPILDLWEKEAPGDFPNYKAGSWGPKASDDLLAKDDNSWRVTNE